MLSSVLGRKVKGARVTGTGSGAKERELCSECLAWNRLWTQEKRNILFLKTCASVGWVGHQTLEILFFEVHVPLPDLHLLP